MPLSPLPLLAVRPSAVVVGDLLLDVVVLPESALEDGRNVAGTVSLRQGGAAGTTARWLARLGVRTAIVASVGRDAHGRALIDAMHGHGVLVKAIRPAGVATGRTAILVPPRGERSLVRDRGAADSLAPANLRDDWFEGIALLHLAAHAAVTEPFASVAREAARLARARSAIVSLNLPAPDALGEGVRRAALRTLRDLAPDIVFGTPAELDALLPGRRPEELLDLAPTVVIKRGPSGATALGRRGDARLRVEVATKPSPASDATGAGDAFDAGFLAAWLTSVGEGHGVTLQKAVAAGHRIAVRHLQSPRPELRLG